ncbi:unnamed protein product [Euphydryas editha]|uniref:DDE Tnp4 domain-containing protein n=1 Tax=Euphydryas editha TaxID=104508 RepID=A0AAU9TPF9_EUPED|nr:unnamed protein product [Euphydryas editha]
MADELLITLVEGRPVLWDKTLDIYKDKRLTYEAWREIFTILNKDFDEMTNVKKNEYELQRRGFCSLVGRKPLNAMDEIEDVIIVSLLCEEEERLLQLRKKPRLWIHDIPKSRYEEGEYHVLLPRLKRDSKIFHTYFRMSLHKFNELVQIMQPYIKREDTLFRKAIGVEEKLMVTMRYLATGDSFKTIAESFRLGYTTVQEIIHTTCPALWEVLSKMVMPIPDEEKWKKIEKEFNEKWNYPNCIGALDGKHVEILSPPKSGSLYFNYKKFFSIVLLALVDANYKFIYVNVGDLGKNSDAGIYSRSGLAKRLEKNTLNIPGPKEIPGTKEKLPHVIVGDEAFPLKPYLMRPYPGTQLDDESKKPNAVLSRTIHIMFIL